MYAFCTAAEIPATYQRVDLVAPPPLTGVIYYSLKGRTQFALISYTRITIQDTKRKGTKYYKYHKQTSPLNLYIYLTFSRNQAFPPTRRRNRQVTATTSLGRGNKTRNAQASQTSCVTGVKLLFPFSRTGAGYNRYWYFTTTSTTKRETSHHITSQKRFCRVLIISKELSSPTDKSKKKQKNVTRERLIFSSRAAGVYKKRSRVKIR